MKLEQEKKENDDEKPIFVIFYILNRMNKYTIDVKMSISNGISIATESVNCKCFFKCFVKSEIAPKSCPLSSSPLSLGALRSRFSRCRR